MEVCVPCKNSACLDIGSNIGPAIDPPFSMNDLKICLTELVIIEDGEVLTSDCDLCTRKNDIDSGVRENKCCELDEITLNESASDKRLSKFATFPTHSGLKPSEDVILSNEGYHGEHNITAEVSELNGSIKTSNKCAWSISLPIPCKLVSAVKGSREKHGAPPKKLSVSWDPDVYDPIPTSVSHVPSSKNQRHIIYGKKSGKHKQKGRGKPSQGSSRGKEKKQGRKNSRSSSKFLPFHEASGVDGLGEIQVSSVDVHVGSPKLFCGSSFLKTSVAKLDSPAAEAT